MGNPQAKPSEAMYELPCVLHETAVLAGFAGD
jgi:hypothetical protein